MSRTQELVHKINLNGEGLLSPILMKRFPSGDLPKVVLVGLMLLLVATPVANQNTGFNQTITQTEIDRIVQSFTAREAEFRSALNQYAFKRDAHIQSLGMGGQVIGEYRRVSYFTFDDKGNRYEKISYFPMPSFGGVTAEDLDDLGGIQPFALEPSKIDRYKIDYVGKERIDELNLYVFDVTPKVVPDPKKTKERLFRGRIWVDDQDLQIVKTKGKGLPETKNNKFPTFETYREQIDNRFWFPTYSYADEELVFDNGSVLRVRMRVRYSDFQPARAGVKVIEVEEAEPAREKKDSPGPTKP